MTLLLLPANCKPLRSRDRFEATSLAVVLRDARVSDALRLMKSDVVCYSSWIPLVL